MSLSLMLSLTACASGSAVTEPVACRHPAVDVKSAGGLAQGLLDYADALDLCNTLNGFGPTK